MKTGSVARALRVDLIWMFCVVIFFINDHCRQKNNEFGKYLSTIYAFFGSCKRGHFCCKSSRRYLFFFLHLFNSPENEVVVDGFMVATIESFYDFFVDIFRVVCLCSYLQSFPLVLSFFFIFVGFIYIAQFRKKIY